MERLEYKYLLPMPVAGELRRLLAPFVVPDAHAAARPTYDYTVRSLYFDTAQLDFYHDKLEGVRERIKLRIRAYGDHSPDATVWLEVKRKTGRVVVKQRARMPYASVQSLFDDGDVERHVPKGDATDLSQEHARRFMYHLYARSLRPVVTTVYEREAWVSRAEPWLRVTVDRQLRYQPQGWLERLFDADGTVYSIPGYCVVEVKTRFNVPLWLQSVLASLRVSQEAVSKYAICVSHRESSGRRKVISPIRPSSRKGKDTSRHVERA